MDPATTSAKVSASAVAPHPGAGDSLREDVARLESEVSQAFMQVDPRLAELEDQLAEARRKIRELRRGDTEVVRDLQMRVQDKIMENDLLSRQNRDLQGVVDELRARVREGESARATSEKVVQRLSESQSSMEIELSEHRKRCRELEARVAELTRKLDQARQREEGLSARLSGKKR